MQRPGHRHKCISFLDFQVRSDHPGRWLPKTLAHLANNDTLLTRIKPMYDPTPTSGPSSPCQQQPEDHGNESSDETSIDDPLESFDLDSLLSLWVPELTSQGNTRTDTDIPEMDEDEELRILEEGLTSAYYQDDLYTNMMTE